MFVLVPLMAALVASPALPATGTAGSRPVARTEVPIGVVGRQDLDRIICRREAVLGSRREKKLCFTRIEWSRREEAAQRMMDNTLWRVGGDKPPPERR
ncbi:MAG: hypothetical protein GC145_15480 [Caulobacter sp.]|nr:hypothetical protein [Caulobacter sp.]